MSITQLRHEDALPDDKLQLTFEVGWSAMRSGHSARQVLAYSVKSDSGNVYETELFLSDLGTICGYCGCPARVVCRHLKAVLADVLNKDPEFGKSVDEGEAK